MALSAPLLILADYDVDGQPTATTLQALTVARDLTAEPVVVAVLGAGQSAGEATLAEFGAARVLTVDAGSANLRDSATYAEAVLAALEHTGAAGVLMTSHYVGREVAARVAVAKTVTPVVDVTRIWAEDDTIHLSKPALAGAWEVTLDHAQGLIVAAIRPGIAEETPAPAAGSVESLSVEFSALTAAVTVVESNPQERTGRTPLGEAQTVVVAGRGIEGDLTPVNDLADILGASVGATRVVTDEGWMPRSLQIGQTGVNISPNLYIGVGVSGAIHHTVGMQSSRHIVAIVDDPDAPIVELADFTVIGDLFEVIPQTIEALKAAGYTA